MSALGSSVDWMDHIWDGCWLAHIPRTVIEYKETQSAAPGKRPYTIRERELKIPQTLAVVRQLQLDLRALGPG